MTSSPTQGVVDTTSHLYDLDLSSQKLHPPWGRLLGTLDIVAQVWPRLPPGEQFTMI